MYTIETLADMFEEAGITSPFSTDSDARNAWIAANPDEPKPDYDQFREHDRLGLDENQLPDRWMSLVHDELSRRKVEVIKQSVNEEIEKLPETLREFIKQNRRSETYMPKVTDLRSLVELATTDRRRQSGKHLLGPVPYQPNGSCNITVRFKDAILYDYEQAAYADHSRYVVPVTVTSDDVDMEACQRNISAFTDALRTHNGFAGSGCTWTAAIHQVGNEYVVSFDCRASISD